MVSTYGRGSVSQEIYVHTIAPQLYMAQYFSNGISIFSLNSQVRSRNPYIMLITHQKWKQPYRLSFCVTLNYVALPVSIAA